MPPTALLENFMTRLCLVVLAVMSLGGFALGWFLLPPPAGETRPAPDPEVKGLAEFTRDFELTAADRHLDRETPAVAVDGRGRILLAWASQTGTDVNVRTL